MTRGRPGRATLLALAVALASAAVWHTATRAIWPVAGLASVEGEGLLWVGPRIGPVGATGDLANAGVIVIGDSRVGHALHLEQASARGLGPFATVWGGGARTEDVLATLDGLRPRVLVVALSALGLVGHPNRPVSETLRVRHPAVDAASPPHLVRAWARSEREHLVGAGFGPIVADATVAWWQENHRVARGLHLRAGHAFDTEGLDRALSHALDLRRALLTQPIEPAEWHRAWFAGPTFRASDSFYRELLAPARAAERSETAERLGARLAALGAAGWRVMCVRLPIDPGLREIEDTAGTTELLEQIVALTGAPFLDFGAWPDAAGDGSHLNWRAADRVTRELGDWLAATLRP